MPYVHRTTAWRHARPWLSAVAVVVLMLVALAGPAAAHSRSAVALLDASVSPRVARPTTTIHFAATYRDPESRPAAAVMVVIDGQPRTMKLARLGEDGTHYIFGARLPVGRHWIRFEAIGTDGGRTKVNGGAVWIKSTAAAGATAPATSEPTPASGSGARSGGQTSTKPGADGAGTNDTDAPTNPPDDGASTPGHARTDADAQADAGSGPAADATDAADTMAQTTPIDPLTDDSASDERPTSDAVAAVGSIGPPGAPGDGSSGGGGSAAGPSSPRGLEVLGLDGAGGLFDVYFRVYPVLVTTGGAAVVWAVFVIFGKRRRDGEPPAPDAVLASHAATAMEPIPAVALVPVPRQLPPGVDPGEADLPRWRRPSLLQARKTDPLRTASVAVTLSFEGADGGPAGLVEGGERRQIRYRLVRLLDLPDESTGRELGVLDAGDEVEIVEAYGIYRLVVCPDGQRGWLHKMVLGDLVGSDGSGEPAPDGIDEDVLAAFLAARRQTA